MKKTSTLTTLFQALVGLFLGRAAASAAEQYVYFGTGGQGGSQGIYRSILDLETGVLSEAVLAAEIERPGFLALHPNGNFLYSVCAVAGSGGGVSAFAIDRSDGGLRRLNTQPSGGVNPCHLTVDRSGKCVLVANYSSGSVAVLPLVEDGTLAPVSSLIQHEGSSVNKQRQQGPHAHSVNVGPANAFAFVADLGTDEVMIYRIDPEAGRLTAHGSVKLKPGSGPRHSAFHPRAEFAYVINEMASTITVFRFDEGKGTLAELQTISTLPGEWAGENTTAEIQVHPSGNFVYGSNRGHNTIAAYRVDRAEGTLSFIEHEPIRGEVPRNFGIDPSGTYLLAAGQTSGTVAVFRIDPESGELKFTGSEIKTPNPICVTFLPCNTIF